MSDLIGREVAIKAVLDGDYIRLKSGECVGKIHKAKGPLTINFESHSLLIVPDTEAIAKKLIDLRGREVDVRGMVYWATADDQARFGQVGYTGTVPAYAVNFTAKSCDLIEEAE